MCFSFTFSLFLFKTLKHLFFPCLKDLSVFLHVFLFLVALAYLSAWRTRIFPCVRPGPSPGPGSSKSVNLKNGPHSSFAAQTHCGCRAAHPHGPKLQVTNSTHNIGLIQTSTKRLYNCHCQSVTHRDSHDSNEVGCLKLLRTPQGLPL